MAAPTSLQIPTVDKQGRPGPKLYLATVIDLYSRRLLGAATRLHPDADVACSAIKMAVAARGGVDAVNPVCQGVVRQPTSSVVCQVRRGER